MKKVNLFGGLAAPSGTISTIITANGEIITGFVQSIEREDCSGQSFNVRIYCVKNVNHCGYGLVRTVHVRTID